MESTTVQTTVFSKRIQVFPPKKFPGVSDSSQLEKAFVAQGCKLHIRKGRSKNAGEEDEEEDKNTD